MVERTEGAGPREEEPLQAGREEQEATTLLAASQEERREALERTALELADARRERERAEAAVYGALAHLALATEELARAEERFRGAGAQTGK